MPSYPCCDHFFNTSLRKLSPVSQLEQYTGRQALLVPTAIISACVLICKLAKTKLGLEVVLLSFFCPLGRTGCAGVAQHCLSPYVQTDNAVQTDGLQSAQNSGLFQDDYLYCCLTGKKSSNCQNTGFMPRAQLHQIAPRGFTAHGQASLVVPVPAQRCPSPPESPKPLWSLPNYDSSQLA